MRVIVNASGEWVGVDRCRAAAATRQALKWTADDGDQIVEQQSIGARNRVGAPARQMESSQEPDRAVRPGRSRAEISRREITGLVPPAKGDGVGARSRIRAVPSRANKFAATSTRSPPARTRRPGGVRRSKRLRVRYRRQPAGLEQKSVGARNRVMRRPPSQERMNSPLELRKVRLRGLGGQGVCGVPGTSPSAAGVSRQVSSRRSVGALNRVACRPPFQERMNSPLELHKVRLRGLGGQGVCGVPGTSPSAAGDRPAGLEQKSVGARNRVACRPPFQERMNSPLELRKVRLC
jgi:hypothetical protein